jgi:hypothetical protein
MTFTKETESKNNSNFVFTRYLYEKEEVKIALLTTILKNLFDNDLFIVKRIKFNKNGLYYNDYNNNIMMNHQKIFNIISDNLIFND